MIDVVRTWRSGAMSVLLLVSAIAYGAEVRVFAAGSLRVAALTVWNVGVAFVFGAVVHALYRRGWLKR